MNLLIWGFDGKMGQTVCNLAQKDSAWINIEGVDENRSVEKIVNKPDVVIDFSHPTTLEALLKYCTSNKVPLVMATTGYSQEQLDAIEKASKEISIMKTSNMSLGMNILFSLVEQVAAMLKDKVDIEVIESHHNRKKDAPSGSAVTIVESIEKGLGRKEKHVYGREGQCPREKGEIGIHAIRGGNIVGYHEADFISDLETVKIVHEAHDRSVFAQGALEAAKFLINKPVGMYNMKDVLGL